MHTSDRTAEAAVVIATKDRTSDLTRAVESVMKSEDIVVDVVVVDQGDESETRRALAPWMDHERFTYIHRAEPGKCKALNTGVVASSAPVLLFTDDDCVVPPGWARTIADLLDNERTGVAFCRIAAAPHDEEAGFIPGFEVPEDVRWTSLWRRTRFGLGAGMGMTRRTLVEIGGFDEATGPGSRFPSADDGDIEMRVLNAGKQVLHTRKTEVLHHGFRTWEEGPALAERDFAAIGGYCAKAVRCRIWGILSTIGYVLVFNSMLRPIWRGLRERRRPTGLGRGVYFMRGFADGMRGDIDRQRVTFVVPSPTDASRRLTSR